MAITYYDIDDQFNPDNIEAAKNIRDEFDFFKAHSDPYKYICSLPEEDDEAVEVNRR